MKWTVPVRQQEFQGPPGAGRLLEYCESDAKATRLVPLKSPKSLYVHPLLNRTPDGLRFNPLAFRQVCGLMCGGLPAVLSTLLTEALTPGDSVVLGIYNSTLRLLGHKLKGYRLVVDDRDQSIVGVVGRSYKLVTNHELLSLLRRSLVGPAAEYRLVRATVYNRELFALAVRGLEPRRSRGVEFRQGIAVYNSETTKRAIFLPRVVFDSQTRGYCYENESDANRMIHRRRKQFAQHLEQMVVTVMRSESMLGEATQRFEILSKTELAPVDKIPRAFQSISSKLIARKINARPADRVLELMGRRTNLSQWDLYAAMVRAAGEYRTSERQLRMVAFEFLTKGQL